MVATPDSDAEFTDDFCGLLQGSVESVAAAELLLTLSTHPDRLWQPRELATQLAPIASLSEVEVQRSLDVFQSRALVVRDSDQRVRYRSAQAHDVHVITLARLYVERPVTLFRVIYTLRDAKISTFADALKLRR